MQMSRFLLLASVLLLAGCGKGSDETPEDVNRDETPGNVDRLHLDKLLGESREKLAEQERTWEDKVRHEETDLQRARDDRQFLGSLRVPMLVPVWQDATWSAEAGISLPPY